MPLAERLSKLCQSDFVVRTGQLLLRPFTQTDVAPLALLANDRVIFEATLSVPFPYSEQDARAWISQHDARRQSGREIAFAVTDSDDGRLMGTVGLIIEPDTDAAIIGYWIGGPFRGQGVATRSVQAVTRWAYEHGAQELQADPYGRNVGSHKVLLRCGFHLVSVRRDQVLRDGSRDDAFVFRAKAPSEQAPESTFA